MDYASYSASLPNQTLSIQINYNDQEITYGTNGYTVKIPLGNRAGRFNISAQMMPSARPAAEGGSMILQVPLTSLGKFMENSPTPQYVVTKSLVVYDFGHGLAISFIHQRPLGKEISESYIVHPSGREYDSYVEARDEVSVELKRLEAAEETGPDFSKIPDPFLQKNSSFDYAAPSQ